MDPWWESGPVTVYHGDCVDVIRTLPDASVDAVVTDPPYALDFMGHGWDRFTPKAFQAWCEVWAAECLRVLKPGGYLVAFGGTRTWHRLAAGVEDAGFEVRDSIAWLYGSGFPKSLDVSKAIDQGRGKNRDRQLAFTAWMRSTGITAATIAAATGTNMASHYLTDGQQPAIATADLFDLLRPHLPEVPEEVERLVAERTGIEWTDYAKRPVTGQHDKPAAAQTWRANVLGGRAAPAVERRDAAHSDEAKRWQGWGTALKPAFEPVVVARKPLAGTVAGNVLAHGTGALNVDACRVGASGGTRGTNYAKTGQFGIGGKADIQQIDAGRWPANVVLDASQAAALDRQSGHQVDGTTVNRNKTLGDKERGTIGHGVNSRVNTLEDVSYGGGGGASRFFYSPKASTAERPRGDDGGAHPTVKPVDLMRWLVRLVTPPGGVVLEPFAGSGTTVEAAVLEGFRCVAVEREATYLPLIRRRLGKPHEVGLFEADPGGVEL